ncbi:FecR family protein [Aestuariibaculum lutulentum]|uniref:FecR domain-containing protein n=1 Tax=Aestuariibaculum lutulentum TaxID=2920935 RepID=A0ABS9RJC7_9FLAO|nr:FecR domain-containing protein [Aestuariibaculum lutulentum]MCH4553058.1 FecR domain-containing protein [Aestuariibaculum lutulentum]
MSKEIEDILLKYLSRSANPEELRQLSKWLEDSKNKQIFKEFVKTNYAITYSVNHPNTKATVETLMNKIRKEPKVFKLQTVFKYAAILILFIAVGIGVYNETYKNEEVIVENALKEILPGDQKATLVLSDGSVVDLVAHQDELISKDELASIQNTKEGLVYDALTNQDELITEQPKINTLNVPVGGVYQIKLPDGTKVWLNSATSLEFPERFVGEQRVVTLKGEAYFDVTKSKRPFIVKTNSADITVLGTQFNVSSYEDDGYFSSTLVEGSIALNSNLKDQSSTILAPGQRAVIEKMNPSIDVASVDTQVYTAWKEGKFYFERESLEQILVKMSRWYNVDVIIENESLKNETFTGVAYKNKPVDYLLNMISKTTKVNYKITKSTSSGKYEITLTK